jgi:methionine sulfoxide reductase heme-binding subunit
MAKLIDYRWMPLFLALILGLLGVGIGMMLGANPADQANLAARWTARLALPFFFVAYAASSLLRMWPSDLTKTLMRRRRQWGLAFALAHTIHLAALGTNLIVFGEVSIDVGLIGGGLAYGLMYLMALTSNNWSVRKLGKYWKWLHRLGIHYTWLIFAQGAAGRLFEPDPEKFLSGLIAAPLLFGALGLRLYLRFRPRAQGQR